MSSLIKQLELADEQQSRIFAQKLASCLHPATVLTFRGDLGAGKTTLIRAMLRALGISGTIKSPSFSLVESYPCQNLQIHHFDLYRIQEEEELDYLGFRDYFTADAICCIEWPEKAGSALQTIDLELYLTMKDRGRKLQLRAGSAVGQRMLACLGDQ